MSQTELKKWSVTGGPRKTKPAQKLINKLLRLRDTKRELNGVVGGEESSRIIQVLFLGAGENDFPEFFRKWDELGEQFGWSISNSNHEQIEKAVAQAHTELMEVLPVSDRRRSPEEDAEGKAAVAKHDAERKAAALAQAAVVKQVLKLAPAGSKRIVIAAYYEDQSDSMIDYFHAECMRRVVIGFSRADREDLRLCKRLAGNFSETADLAAADKKDVERRFGSGYPRMYVGTAGYFGTGWKVHSEPVAVLPHTSRMEIADYLLNQPKSSGPAVDSGGYDIEESFHTKKNFTMFVAVPNPRLDTDSYIKERARCEAAGGWYSRAWKGSPGGFAFKSKVECEAFASTTQE